MSDVFSSEERAALEALAYRRGFGSLRDYLWALIHEDVAQEGESAEDYGGPPENLRRVWDDAMNRRPMSWEEFLRRLGE